MLAKQHTGMFMNRSDHIHQIRRHQVMYGLRCSEPPKDMFGRKIAPGDVVLFPSTNQARIGAILEVDSDNSRAKLMDAESHKFAVLYHRTLAGCIRVQSVCDDDPYPMSDLFLQEITKWLKC